MEQNHSSILKNYYETTYYEYGPTPQGIHWGTNQEKINARYQIFANYIMQRRGSFLEVACGYGELLNYIKNSTSDFEYTGIDISNPMINYAKSKFQNKNITFICNDILNFNFSNNYDYVICNGLLTTKSSIEEKKFDIFVKKIIKKLFTLCKKGIFFNMMTSFVDFKNENIFYKKPSILFNWLVKNISSNIILYHGKIQYEYFIEVNK